LFFVKYQTSRKYNIFIKNNEIFNRNVFIRQLTEIRDPKIIAKKSAQLEMKEVQKYARRNVESSLTATIIPRTMREPQCNVNNFFFFNICNIF